MTPRLVTPHEVSAEPRLPAAVRAFEGAAPEFDHRFGGWLSVAAQRRAVRNYLSGILPRNGRVLELGGGTGEDALYLARRGLHILCTDGAPAMVTRASAKIRSAGYEDLIETRELVVERLETFAAEWGAAGGGRFDAAYANFAVLNCVRNLASLTGALGQLLRPGGALVLVVFGTCCPWEILLQLLRGSPGAAFRRFRDRPVPAQLGGRPFVVHYHRARDIARALHPHFSLVARRGIGIFVPPSAAEPAISRWPRVLRCLEQLDRFTAAPLAPLGDHLLLHFRRTSLTT